MFDIRQFNNKAIVAFLILGLAFVEGVGALAQQPSQLKIVAHSQVAADDTNMDPNMVFRLVPSDVLVKTGDEFIVTVTVSNAKDMFGWQVYLSFDLGILQYMGTYLPSNQIFSNRVTISDALTASDSTEFTTEKPLQDVDLTRGRVLAGDCLLGANQPTFQGSGILCQIEFKAISSGSCTLVLFHNTAHFQTFNLNSEIEAVTAASDSCMNVHVV